jgi:hypothetical protein
MCVSNEVCPIKNRRFAAVFIELALRPAPALVGATCVRQLRRNESLQLARQDCRNVDPRKWRRWGWAWYKLDLRYHGTAANYIFCVATGYGRSGRVQTLRPPWGISLDGIEEEPIQGAHVKPGEALHVYYHLFKPPRGSVARYVVKCRVIPEPPS